MQIIASAALNADAIQWNRLENVVRVAGNGIRCGHKYKEVEFTNEILYTQIAIALLEQCT